METVTQISRSVNPDVFVDNMKRNSHLQNTFFLYNTNALMASSSEKGCKHAIRTDRFSLSGAVKIKENVKCTFYLLF